MFYLLRKNSNFPLYHQLFGLFLPHLSFKRAFSLDFYDYLQLIIYSTPCSPLVFAPTLTLAFEHGTDTLALQHTLLPLPALIPFRPALQKRPRYSKKSPTFFRKSPTFFRKFPTFLRKAPMFQKYVATSLFASPALLTFHLAHNRSLLSAPSCFSRHFPLPPKGLALPHPTFILTSLHNPHFCQGFLTRIRAYTGIYIFSLSQPSQTPLITYYKSAISAKLSDNF